MRILIASAFALHRAGGIGTYVREVKSGLEAQGHSVHIFAPHSTIPMQFALDENVVDKEAIRRLVYPAIRQYTRQEISHGPRSLIQFLELERYCLEVAALYFGLSGFDLIHAQDAVTSLALARVKPTLTPLITTLHSSMSAEFLIQRRVETTDRVQGGYLQHLEQAGVSASDEVVVPSQWLRSYLLQRLQVDSERIKVVRSGLDIPQFVRRATAPASLRLPSEQKLIVCAARLDAVKGHEYLLEALTKLKRIRNDWICCLLGDGPLMEHLAEQAKLLGLREQVVFAGEQPDVAPYLKAADVVVLSSVQENLPYVVMEAQVAGTPVVATDVGGISEMITHGETGLLSSSRDSEALCRNINRVLVDPTISHRISCQAQRFALREWSKDRMISDILSTYQGVLPAHGKQALRREDAPDYRKGSVGNRDRPRGSKRHLSPADNYQSLFSRDVTLESVRVQSFVWDRVMQNLPAGYQIPDSLLTDYLGSGNRRTAAGVAENTSTIRRDTR